LPIRSDTSSLPVSGRFDFNRTIAQHLRRKRTASLLNLAYPEELLVKQGSLEQFWEQHRLPGRPEEIIASPMPRHYRTTSKRRIKVHQGRITAELDHIDLESLPEQAHLMLLEPEAHRQIYELLLGYLEKPAYREFAKHVNFLIIRGTYTEHSVIFNVDQFDAEVVRKGKLLAAHMQESPVRIVSAYMFLDPSRSDYYLESRRPDEHIIFKKLFGPENLSVEIEGRRFYYEPTGFSQVNLAMVPELLRVVRELLPGDPGAMLLDLYCGYGLFGISLAPSWAGVIGLDAAPGAIRAATANHQHLLPEANVVFSTASIDGRALRRLLPEPDTMREYVILDPPRSGTHHGVIPVLAGRKPAAVVHIFCGIEQIPREVPDWLHAGYRLDRIVPLDLFPGTANLECCLLFTPRPPAPPQTEEPEAEQKPRFVHKGRVERTYKKRTEGETGTGEPKRPFKPRRESGPARPARPYKGKPDDRKRSEEGAPGRPFKPRRESGPDRPARPYKGKPDDRKRSEEGAPGRPFKPRRESGPARPARPYKGKPDDRKAAPPARDGKGRPADRKGKPAGGYGKGRKGKPADSKRSFGRKGPGK